MLIYIGIMLLGIANIWLAIDAYNNNNNKCIWINGLIGLYCVAIVVYKCIELMIN